MARIVRQKVPVFSGRITNEGRWELAPDEAENRKAYFQSLAGQHVGILVRPWKVLRSERANNYYWGQVLTPMSVEGSDGDQSPEEIHDAMCAMFLPNEPKRVEFFNRMTGEALSVDTDGRRSSKLQGEEFYVFVEKVRKFALEFMGVRTENPDPEYWRRRARKVA